MGMSSHVVFLRDPNDPEHQVKVKVLRACLEAKVELPPEIDDYFGGEMNEELPLEVPFMPREWRDDGREGFEIDVADIPGGVKTIRFYNSW